MFWIAGGGALMAGLQALRHNAVTDAIVYQLHHTPWQGLRFYDIIWPSFMLMVGISVPFSVGKASLTQSKREMLRRALTRAVILFLLGSVRESVAHNHPYFVELSSALQPIALAYLVAFLLSWTSPRIQAAIAALLLIAYALLLVPGGYRQGANLVLTVDLAVLGRAHAEGWGTVLSTIPTISTTLLGLLVGELLISHRPVRRKAVIIGITGVCGVALGLALDPVIPIVMKLWTTSYGLATAGWACLLFLLFYSIIDVLGYRKWAFPFVVIGMNAIFIYMAGSFVPLTHIAGIFTRGVVDLGQFEPLVRALLIFATEWLVLFWMYRRKIFIKA